MLFLFILHSVVAAGSFFWSKRPQAGGRNPSILSQVPLLTLAGEGQRPPSTPWTIALPLLTPSPPPIATSVDGGKAQLQEPRRGRPQAVWFSSWLKVRKQPLQCCCVRWVRIKPFYFFYKRAEGKPPMEFCCCFQNLLYYTKFRRWAEEGEMAPRLLFTDNGGMLD